MTTRIPLAFALLFAATPAFAGGGDSKGGGSIWSDTDGDGVHDAFDDCNGTDDTIDIDADGTKDCVQNFLGSGPMDDSGDAAAWWNPSGGGSWDSTDANNYSGSGSLDLGLYGIGTEYVVSDCHGVNSNLPHTLMAEISAYHSSGSVDVRIMVIEYKDGACATGNFSTRTITQHTTNTTDPSGWEVIGTDLYFPYSSTKSIEVMLVDTSPGSTGSATTDLLVDNILLHDDVNWDELKGGDEAESADAR